MFPLAAIAHLGRKHLLVDGDGVSSGDGGGGCGGGAAAAAASLSAYASLCSDSNQEVTYCRSSPSYNALLSFSITNACCPSP